MRPAAHRPPRKVEFIGHWPDTAEAFENIAIVHEGRLSHMIAQLQVPQSHFLCAGYSRTYPHMDSDGIIAALKRLGVRHDRIADAIGRDRTAATKMLAGRRAVKAGEFPALTQLIAEAERDVGEMPIDTNDAEYLPVELLPSFAGMGGGGTGDADTGTGLVSRRMIEDELRIHARQHEILEDIERYLGTGSMILKNNTGLYGT